MSVEDRNTRIFIFFRIVVQKNGVPVALSEWNQLYDEFLGREYHYSVYSLLVNAVRNIAFEPSGGRDFLDEPSDNFKIDRYSYDLYHFGDFKKEWLDIVNERIEKNPDVFICKMEDIVISIHFQYASLMENEIKDGW